MVGLHAAGPAEVDLAVQTLTVTHAGHTLSFTPAEFAALPHSECLTASPHGGPARRYGGVTMHDLLAQAGVSFGQGLHGAALRLAVIISAIDGYAVVFSLADFDPALTDRVILLADRMEGGPLPAKLAPRQLIVPGDKRGARWIRMVKSVEVVEVRTAVAPASSLP